MDNPPLLDHDSDKQTLLEVARDSIQYGLQYAGPKPIDLKNFPASLQALRATFVTLRIQENLRGCIGSLDPIRPLVRDVAYNAYAAAFKDPRMSPLTFTELNKINISISILSPLESLDLQSETELLNFLKPGVHGLVLVSGHQRGTFLPSVWEMLPDPKDFIQGVKQKAGISAKSWPAGMQASIYTSLSFSESIE